MTVDELIAKLMTMPSDTNVLVEYETNWDITDYRAIHDVTVTVHGDVIIE
jgi:hypothetical protein